MARPRVDDALLARLRGVVAPARVLDDAESRDTYGRDKTKNYHFPPDVVVKAESLAEIREVIRIGADAGIAVTPRGAGTGLSGGCLPVEGGIVLSTERMKVIHDVDEKNRMVVVGPGVITGDINRALEPLGLFYPPDPASLDSCTIGGNAAENAGGPRAVKYGVTSHFLTGAEFTTGAGDTLRLGGKLRKNVTGLNLLGLTVGSEGILGVFSQLTFRLVGLPQRREVYLADFAKAETACDAVWKILAAGVTPSALELMSREAVEVACALRGLPLPPASLGAKLLIELDGDRDADFTRDRDRIGQAVLETGADDLTVADTHAKQEAAWKLRRSIGEAVKHRSAYEEEDVVVPQASMGVFFTQARELLKRHGLEAVMYGHAGDGNIHCNILQGRHDAAGWNTALEPATAELFELVKRLGGTLTGEHGVGLVQRENFKRFVDPAEHELTRRIKGLLDPAGILNPGKMI